MSYAEAKAKYSTLGIDTDAAIRQLKSVPVSLHCWQGDDVRGFDTDPSKPLTGGIQTTGNYPGRASTPDASINRISAWITGFRNVEKTLLFALLQPNTELKGLQDEGCFTKLMVLQEELKTFPFGDIWAEYCRNCNVPSDGSWFTEIERYEEVNEDERYIRCTFYGGDDSHRHKYVLPRLG